MFWQAVAALGVGMMTAVALIVETRNRPEAELPADPMASAWAVAAAASTLTPLWFALRLFGEIGEPKLAWSQLAVAGALVIAAHAVVQFVPAWIGYRWQKRRDGLGGHPTGRVLFPVVVAMLVCVTVVGGIRVWIGGFEPSRFRQGQLTPGYATGWGAEQVLRRNTRGAREILPTGVPVDEAKRGVIAEVRGVGLVVITNDESGLVMNPLRTTAPAQVRFSGAPTAAWSGPYGWVVAHRRSDGAISAVLASGARLLSVDKSRVAPLLEPPRWPLFLGALGVLLVPLLWRMRNRVLRPHDLVFASWLLLQITVVEAAAYAPYL